ncbi:heavy metal sensor histidine kinase [Oceanimonas sp. GK1]|uniref:heavy metal sensor histidine kinase n=1 Tax=Oceanimonas sp. (strain GK1 / IBRC-M 10197) TaxID=511062 RepID=UPI0002494F31|nr:heavy metal sensor histidine kinase [Oceanimonas sp. GK1]AEY00754.1 heavy metal sensor histidine kinase [Oceanimonas sp. GK1]
MKRVWSSLSLRLSLMFALVSALLLGSLGFYLYYSLERELAWRDDQSLLGRLEHMQALLSSSDSITDLRDRPTLYANMLGNEDSLLWVLNLDGEVLISVNPAGLAVPTGLPAGETRLGYNLDGDARLAWRRLELNERSLMLVAGKLLAPREQMLAAYRLRLLLALAGGALMAFALGWLVSRRGLAPVRRLAAQAGAIEVRRLHRRLNTRALPDELRELGESLNHMLARLEDGFGRLSRFSEDLAHEIRTPLSNLMGHTEHSLRRPRSTEEYETLLASQLEEYQRLARMVDSMLFLARTEQPQAQIRLTSISLPSLVAQLCDYFEGMAEEASMALVNRTEGEVRADEELLRRALANLLANALRYGVPGQPITISSGRTEKGVFLSVHNMGPAIASEHLPRLFDRFYRCDPSRTQGGDTGGLGLSIVDSIMQLHGGEVSVHSDDNGTTFTLRFPA